MIIVGQNKIEMVKRPSGFGSCEKGVKRAKNDFNQGIYNSYSYGLVSDVNPEFTKFYKNYMLEKYKIKTGNQGCVVTDEKSCYTTEMNLLLRKKYGENIFKRSKTEAKIAYGKL